MLTVLRRLDRGIRYIENVLLAICGVIFMAMIFLGTADVIGRYAFDSPVLGTQELMQVMMGAIVMLGWAYTQKEDGHVKVALVTNLFPARTRNVLNLVMTILALFLFIIIAYKSWGIASANFARRFLVIDFPSGPFYFLVPVGAFFLCLEFIVSIFHISASIGSGEKNVNA
jgi:TRAP-type C4-dicarboxylate transport system permease small subunit